MGLASTSRRSAVLLTASVSALLLAALVTGCAFLNETPTLTEADNGSSLVLQAGEEFVVELESNPSTGYAWSLDGELPNVVEQVGKSEYSAPDSDAVGVAGIERWTFKAIDQGTGEVYLRYWRSSDPETENEETFTVEVTVREP